MIQKRALIGFLLVAVLIGTLPVWGVAAPAPAQTEQAGTELLKNPGFEGLTCPGVVPPDACLPGHNFTHAVHIQDGIVRDNIETPEGWVTWWREAPPDWNQPEIVLMPITNANYTGQRPRIRNGSYAVKAFGFNRNFDGGFYQLVSGLQPGATVQFSAYAHTWSCGSMEGDNGPASSCGDPWNMAIQVGIEPNGLADPFSPSISWSPEQYSPDSYRLIGPWTAQVGTSGTVVVFLRTKSKWAVEHNDAYWDDASLVYVGAVVAPTDTPQPPPPTATPGGPAATPRSTPTPRPDGAIVHLVESGDTVFGIALMYNVSTDQIRQLNAGSIGEGDLIGVGQELVISLPSQAPTSTPLPPPPTPESAAAVAAPVAIASAGASICVLAFHDRNGDTLRDETTEELLPNAGFTLADMAGVRGQYTTDGISEPHCFAGLSAGAYRVIMAAPPGYASNGPAEWDVAVTEGATLPIQFGNTRSESPAGSGAGATPTPENGGESGGSGVASSGRGIFSTIARVSGVILIILAIGVATLFFLTRRRM